MYQDQKIIIGKGEREVCILPAMANRHGLIAGATGTGKTVTLKVMAESFSDLGVPVFLADIKGDLAGCAKKGAASDSISRRLKAMGMDETAFAFRSYPVCFWDVFGESGHPVRTPVGEMGAMLLSHLLGLTEVQSGVMNIVYRIADDRGWLLIDLKDLRAMLSYVAEHAPEFLNDYGTISKQSVGAIQRALLRLEDEGAEAFFGEPGIDIADWMQQNDAGQGHINILHCAKLYRSPLLYATFMLWLLSELFEKLPEAGDLEKPKLVFFFDEAHLLFNDAPKALVDQIEQVVKLIRSKGVGVYFITQQPSDIPDPVLAQLGNRVQHALRAYTPAEQRAVRAAAQSFRKNPAFDTETAITELGTGEALISVLDEAGRPTVVQRAHILPPQSAFGTIDDARRQAEIQADAIYGKYENAVDHQSAYEIIADKRKKQLASAEEENVKEAKAGAKKASMKKTSDPMERLKNKAIDAIGREIGRSISRGLLGSIKKLW